MPFWWPDDDGDTPEVVLPDVVDDPFEVVGELLGPDGEPLSVLLDRPWSPLGFRPGGAAPERVHRVRDWSPRGGVAI